MANYTIVEGQTLFDVALQLYGDCTKAYQIVKDNPELTGGLLERNLIGRNISYTEQTNFIANQYKTNGVIIANQYPAINTLSAFSSAFSSSFSTPSTA